MDLFSLARPVLHRLPPELVHSWTIRAMALVGGSGLLRRWVRGWTGPPVHDPIRLWDLELPNRVGLAAGYDKDARAWRGLGALGFGHLELGTVTPRPQPGNPRPRVFRLSEDRALVNRLGFPSAGSEAFASRLPAEQPTGGPILGVNLGKQKETPLAEAVEDYVGLLRRLGGQAGYVAVNLSSPNTPELRRLQGREYLGALLSALVRERDVLAGRRVPLLLKLAPDLGGPEIDEAVDTALEAGVDGLIATNTTVSRPPGLRSPMAGEPGGLSGAPLGDIAAWVLEHIANRVGGRVPLVAVGGIMSGEDARRRRDAGATLVQIYTGLVYGGPGLVREIAAAVRG